LFRSIGYLFERNPETAPNLRRVIAEAIKNNPFEYSEAILGKDPEDYCRWIQTSQAWGGAIELAIFSEHYKTEIDSIDIATCRVDRFGEGKYENRVLVLYSGIHYDAVALNPMQDGPSDFDMTTFSVNSEGEKYLLAGIRLAEELKKVIIELCAFEMDFLN
jgi:ubiquitin thioesterase OTU1